MYTFIFIDKYIFILKRNIITRVGSNCTVLEHHKGKLSKVRVNFFIYRKKLVFDLGQIINQDESQM